MCAVSRFGRRRWRRVAVVVAVALAVPVAVGASRDSASSATVVRSEALLVGDSVMNGMAQSYGLAARQLLAARHSFVLDTAGCRRLITTSCRIGSSPTPTNALTAIRARAGQYDQVLVVGAGYNDTTNGTTGVGAAVDVLIAEAHRQGIDHVVWLTYREAGSSASRFRAHNAVLRLKDIAYPELTIADWAARSAAMPSSWFSSDGIHLGADAAKGMADLIADVLDLLPPDPPPSTSTTTTTTPCRVTETTISITTAPPPFTTVGVMPGGAAAVVPAARLQSWCPPTTG